MKLIKLFLVLIIALTIMNVGCSNNEPNKANDKTSQNVSITHKGVGVIKKIDADKKKLTIDHEEIKGFMEAMVMDFYVADKALINGLKEGDKVEFTLKYENGLDTITELKKLQ